MTRNNLLVILILVSAFPIFGQQNLLDNPVIKGYYEENNGIIDAIEITDSVQINLTCVKITSRYIDIYYDVYNKSCRWVAARTPCPEDLETGEIRCVISIGKESFYYNLAISEFRYQLIDSTNSVFIQPNNHYIGYLRLSRKELELRCSYYKIKNINKSQLKATLLPITPKLIISQFSDYSYFNFGQNTICFTLK